MTDPKQPRSGRPAYSPIRWTREMIAKEHNWDVRAIPKELARLSIAPGGDDCFSTAQVSQMVFGDLEAEKLKKLTAERKTAEMKEAEMAGSLVPKSAYVALVEDVATQVRQIVENAKYLDAPAREKLLAELRKVKMETR